MPNPDTIAVIGAGMGGLAAAIRLAAAGRPVVLFEAGGTVGGKMRTLPSLAGPVDAGPTVLTMRDVFDDLFACAGVRLQDRLTLTPLPILARHLWADGSSLDLHPDPEANAAAIRAMAGPGAESQFRAFGRHTAALRAAFEGAVMRAPGPRLGALGLAALARPALWPALMPGVSLAADLSRRFTDPRLRQLFGRYATYVGGMPQSAPAVLALIWQAEGAGVWAVQGGMARLAQALGDLARELGVDIRLNAPVERIGVSGGRVSAVHPRGGEAVPVAAAVFNGDPRALSRGLLGPDATRALPRHATEPRSLSARVWAFAARPSGVDLAYHTVFFADAEADEFAPLARGENPAAPTIYVCAQDRAGAAPEGPERFEMILNAPPLPHANPEDAPRCRQTTFARLARMGLEFDSLPELSALTRPQEFDALFPGSAGSIYGRSPAGVAATFLRPRAGTRIPGLILAGGGVHPGAGVPMAALSGLHAAAAVGACLQGRGSIWRSGRTAMPGGTSTGSATTAPAPSR
jgi:1-hydroxycarotenoid 3,4-desaturase